MKVSLVVCDVCQSPDKETRHYDVRVDQDRLVLDLCADHSTHLDELFEHFSEQGGKRPTGGRARKVTTMEEIERLKRTKASNEA